jgi:hypothetical protein
MLGFFNRILDLVYIELDVFIVGHRRLTYIHLRDEIRGRWEKIIFFKRDITNAPSSMLCRHEIFTERNFDEATLFQADYSSAPLSRNCMIENRRKYFN